MGDDTAEYHKAIGRGLGNYSFDMIAAVGELSVHTIDGAKEVGISSARLQQYENVKQAIKSLPALLQEGDTVYLKGSRGIGLERILELFTSQEGSN